MSQRHTRSVKDLCELLGYSRQSYYQQRKYMAQQAFKEDLIIQEVLEIRRLLKKSGGRKLWLLLQPFFQQHQFSMGRDSFYTLLRNHNLLIKKKKKKSTLTTFSNHRFRKYPNMIENFIPMDTNELWVDDITYIRLQKDFAYLSIITDAYSRKIVGFCLYPTLEAQGCMNALEMAIDKKVWFEKLIHHSDRGVQYCSDEYVEFLKKNNIKISMTQQGDPLENAIAERVNGILKDEFLDEQYHSFQNAIAIAINTYNHLRLHSSINYLTPQQAHQSSGNLPRKWKNYYKPKKNL